ncbi:MAG: DUF309 domain-containing protein [Pseudopedobacter sp.]|nr:DUF309 domain-containing protein [Deinococcales bacterium]
MRPHLEHGAKLFNAGEFWEAHEAWEGPWMDAKKTGDALEAPYLQGLILLAAALHKARAYQNFKGGRLNFEKAKKHLECLPDGYGARDELLSLSFLMLEVELALENDSKFPQLKTSE